MKHAPLIIAFILSLVPVLLKAEDGYRLWLRYDKVDDTKLLQEYQRHLNGFLIQGNSPTLRAAQDELQTGLTGLLGSAVPLLKVPGAEALIAGMPSTSPVIADLNLNSKLSQLGDEGYLIRSMKVMGNSTIVIASQGDVGVLYGVFHFLRLLQSSQSIENLSIENSPRIKLRILDHWDNLDRTVERGYAGFSIWKWHELPDYIDPRYLDYARANASIGINGSVLTNVNANALVLTPQYLEKVAALANVFRPYGIHVYLTARFSAPIELGDLKTADPLDPAVRQWWSERVKEIYKYIPDFGGFLVKANSEGQPGPQDYQRTHADGANMLADALAPFHGVVMWRAFVYSQHADEDRHMQAYNEFKPLDGSFRANVLLQVKNGPIDFQPREPFHPLFGAMPKTPLMMEFQITQEYLGQGTHLVYLAPLFKECLESDSHAEGPGSTVAKVVEGILDDHRLSGMAGVANIGDDRNWCGHPFAQANWFAFGRLAWNPELSSAEIADEWIRMTFSNDHTFIDPVKKMMLASREITVDYMTPLGLHHIMASGHHYGPGPWVGRGRPDWTALYYHKADSMGIGFDRSSSGSKALSQYRPQVKDRFESLSSCPEEYLLWFHHVPWDHRMASGRTLWQELCHEYYQGADSVRWMQSVWSGLKGKIDDQRYQHVSMLLTIQEKEARWWRDACILYFQTFSGMPVPDGLPKPEKTLEYYENLRFPYSPGIRPRW